MKYWAFLASGFAATAWAHPQHGSPGWLSASISHLLSEPDHLAWILVPALVACGLVWRRFGPARAPRAQASASPDRRRA